MGGWVGGMLEGGWVGELLLRCGYCGWVGVKL